MSARDTLLEHLSPRQRAEFERTGSFTVRGRWGRRYLVRAGASRANQVWGSLLPWPFPGRIKFGIWTCGVCDADELIALKLLLEADERGFRKQACYRLPFV